jgi:hypothetical protein
MMLSHGITKVVEIEIQKEPLTARHKDLYKK